LGLEEKLLFTDDWLLEVAIDVPPNIESFSIEFLL
jgi:hypothetical protein